MPVKKSTLLVSPFFFPEPISTGKYNTHLARALADAGDTVLCCCSHPLYPDWVPRESDEQLPGVQIFRGGLKVRYPRSVVLRRLVLELWFSFHALYIASRFRGRFDRVIAVFPPSLFYYLLTLVLPRSVVRIGIVHDLQGLLGLSGSGLLKRVFARIVKHVETVGFQSCNRLILLSEGMKARVVEDYLINPSICSVRYPFVTEVHGETAGVNLKSIFASEFKHVVYSGALGDKQAPFSLLALFEALVRLRQDVVCHLFSRGPLFEEMSKSAAQDLQGRLLFHDLVDECDLPELYARSSVQIIPQKPGTSDGAFPSKLPNLLAAGVPVFAITDRGSEVQQLLDASGVCCCSSTWEHSDLLPKLNSFLDCAATNTHAERVQALKPFIEKYFSIQNLVTEIQTLSVSDFKMK